MAILDVTNVLNLHNTLATGLACVTYYLAQDPIINGSYFSKPAITINNGKFCVNRAYDINHHHIAWIYNDILNGIPVDDSIVSKHFLL